MKVTVDTNILVSATFWTGSSFKILELIDEKKIKSISSIKIIEEYNKVMNSDEIIEKIDNKKLIISKIVERVIGISDIIEPKIKVDIVKDDPDDNKILECAKEGKVNYIITQDEHLLKLKEFENIPIVKPEAFLTRFKEEV